jgi:hypothetical protein
MVLQDGPAVQALCLAAFRHCLLHSSQFAFASAGRCTAALLWQRTVIKIVDFWVQVVLFAFDSVSFGTRQTLSKSQRRWNTIDWRPVYDWFMGLIAGQLSSISSRWAIAWPFAVWKVTAKGLILKRKKKKEKRFAMEMLSTTCICEQSR